MFVQFYYLVRLLCTYAVAELDENIGGARMFKIINGVKNV
jgi:hypothetical protein